MRVKKDKTLVYCVLTNRRKEDDKLDLIGQITEVMRVLNECLSNFFLFKK